jgi:aquaporin Z
MFMKRGFVEMLGACLLTMAITLTGNPLAIGLMLTACLVFGAHISGGHYNPAVSLALFVHQKISLHTFLKYAAFQVLGAIVALTLFRVVAGSVFVPDITAGLNLGILFAIEAILTCLLCLVIITIHEKRSSHGFDPHGALLIGIGLMSIAFIGGIFNPAVIIGSIVHQLVAGGISIDIQQVLVQLVAPLVGGAASHYIYHYINN